jgi:hypothetical protein
MPETISVLGPEEGGHLAGAAARLVGMHTFDEVARLLGGVEAAGQVSPRPSPGWPAGRTTTRNYSWKVRVQPCARRRGA